MEGDNDNDRPNYRVFTITGLWTKPVCCTLSFSFASFAFFHKYAAAVELGIKDVEVKY